MKLTETKCQKATRKEKLYRLPDGRGLYLVVTERGNKRWEYRYSFMKKAKTISMGLYPEVSLEEAREKREDARKLLSKDIDPSQVRQKIKQQKVEDNKNTFESVVTDFLNSKKNDWSESHHVSILRILKKFYPYIGDKPIKKIISTDILKGLSEIESEGKFPTAKKALQYTKRVLNFAIRRGLLKYNVADSLHEDLTTSRTKHYPALIEPEEVGKLMLDIDSYKRGRIQVYLALRFLALTFVRSCEVRHAQWFEINWKKKQWTINVEKTKMGKKEKKQNSKDKRDDHIVPLSRQALEILHEMHDTFSKGVAFKGDEYIFPGTRNSRKPISISIMNKVLKRLGYKNRHCTHGFRVTARTLLDEERDFRIDWIEHQLAHRVIDANGRAYNRTTHLKGRRGMMQDYADYLDKLKAEAEATEAGKG